jgi:hypothetical protein
MAQFRLDNIDPKTQEDRFDAILSGTMRSAGNGGFNIGQIALATEDLVREITEKFEDALAGSSVDDSGELSVLSNIARQLNLPSSGAGLASFANHALARLEERAANNGGGSENVWSRITEERKRDEREKDREDERGDYRQNARQALQQRAEELRAMREQETVGNVTMSRAEWGDLATAIRTDEKTRNWFIEYYMQQGLTKAQAEQKTKETEELAAALAKPANQRTPADIAAITRGRNDSAITRAIEQHEDRQTRGFSAEAPTTQAAALGSDLDDSAINRASAFENGMSPEARRDPDFTTSFSAYNKLTMTTNDDAMTYVSTLDPSGLEDRFRVEVQDDSSNRRQIDLGNGVTVSQLNSPDGGVKSGIILGAEFAKANVAVTPLDAQPIATTQRPRIVASVSAPSSDGFL